MPEAKIKVKDVMRTELHMINGLAPVREAIVKLSDGDVGALVIERRHEEDEYGFVSVDNIAKRVIAPNRSIDRTNVYEIMDKPTLTVTPIMAVKYAIRLLSQLDQDRALVVDESGACGLVTLRDMVHSYAMSSDTAS